MNRTMYVKVGLIGLTLLFGLSASLYAEVDPHAEGKLKKGRTVLEELPFHKNANAILRRLKEIQGKKDQGLQVPTKDGEFVKLEELIPSLETIKLNREKIQQYCWKEGEQDSFRAFGKRLDRFLEEFNEVTAKIKAETDKGGKTKHIFDKAFKTTDRKVDLKTLVGEFRHFAHFAGAFLKKHDTDKLPSTEDPQVKLNEEFVGALKKVAVELSGKEFEKDEAFKADPATDDWNEEELLKSMGSDSKQRMCVYRSTDPTGPVTGEGNGEDPEKKGDPKKGDPSKKESTGGEKKGKGPVAGKQSGKSGPPIFPEDKTDPPKTGGGGGTPPGGGGGTPPGGGGGTPPGGGLGGGGIPPGGRDIGDLGDPLGQDAALIDQLIRALNDAEDDDDDVEDAINDILGDLADLVNQDRDNDNQDQPSISVPPSKSGGSKSTSPSPPSQGGSPSVSAPPIDTGGSPEKQDPEIPEPPQVPELVSLGFTPTPKADSDINLNFGNKNKNPPIPRGNALSPELIAALNKSRAGDDYADWLRGTLGQIGAYGPGLRTQAPGGFAGRLSGFRGGSAARGRGIPVQAAAGAGAATTGPQQTGTVNPQARSRTLPARLQGQATKASRR